MKTIPSADLYRAIWERERDRDYPTIDAFEAAHGYQLPRAKLEAAARVLACPVKVHPPNWQHGRVIYALAAALLVRTPAGGPVTLLDIGTAKGFSALCLEWARRDLHVEGRVVSVDVIDPAAAVLRNTVAECAGPQTLAQILAPWPEAETIEFRHDSGLDWLARTAGRIRFAFVDGKHTHDVVKREGFLIADRQHPGDVVLFDDVQLWPVASALSVLREAYDFQFLEAAPERIYGIGIRR
jgi:predicted O-methyltransferase YrrM